jgi:hypothetical protein
MNFLIFLTMTSLEIQDFINFKRFAIIISTNFQPEYNHETIALAYDFNDILNGRYSDFWSKHGGYKEDLVLFPNDNINVLWVNTNDKTDKNEVIFYKFIPDYIQHLQKLKLMNKIEDSKHFDPNHMYYRFYNFGTCVEKSLNHIYWNCKWNNIDVNGWSIRRINFMKKFGTVMKFSDLISQINEYIHSSLQNIKIEQPLKITLTEEQEYKLQNYNIILLESNIKSRKINDLVEINKAYLNNIEELKNKLIEIELIYQEKLKLERKTRKIDIDREKTITNRYQRQYNELNKKYLKNIEKYEDELTNLKYKLNYNENDDKNKEKIKVIKEKQFVTKYYLNEMLWFIALISIIINVGLIINICVSNN